MKIQIDFTAKIIKIESNVNFGEFVTKLQEMLPDWKDYSIYTNTTIEWREFPVWKYRRNVWPWTDITYSNSGHTILGTTSSDTYYVKPEENNNSNILNIEI